MDDERNINDLPPAAKAPAGGSVREKCLAVVDDLPPAVPVSVRELQLIEAFLGAGLDELLDGTPTELPGEAAC